MGQGHLQVGGTFNPDSTVPRGVARYRVIALVVLTMLFVAAKVVAHDHWAVAFGLAVAGIILLSPESPAESSAWRQHALRIVLSCFVVVTLASIWTTLSGAY